MTDSNENNPKKIDRMMPDFSMEFVKNWLDRAEKEPDSSDNAKLMKFFCYYIAFNSVYSGYAYVNSKYLREKYPDDKPGDTVSERHSIKELIFYFMDYRFDAFNDWNPYTLISPKGLEKAVISQKYRNRDVSYAQRGLDHKNKAELFGQIYKVRCNLFHGSKQMISLRDNVLIDDCNAVLKDFLERILKLVI